MPGGRRSSSASSNRSKSRRRRSSNDSDESLERERTVSRSPERRRRPSDDEDYEEKRRKWENKIHRRHDQTNKDTMIIYGYQNGRGNFNQRHKFQFTKRQLQKYSDDKLQFVKDNLAEFFGLKAHRSKMWTIDGLIINDYDRLIHKGVYVIGERHSSYVETYYEVPSTGVDTAKLWTIDGIIINDFDRLIHKGVYVLGERHSAYVETYYEVPSTGIDTSTKYKESAPTPKTHPLWVGTNVARAPYAAPSSSGLSSTLSRPSVIPGGKMTTEQKVSAKSSVDVSKSWQEQLRIY